MWVQHAKVDHASKQTYLQSNWNILVGALFVSSNVPFWKIHLFAFLVQLIYAANYSLAKQVMPSFVLPYAFIVIRVLGACFLFFILAIFVKNKVKIAKGDWPKIVVASLFGVVFNMLLFFKGLSLTTPINAAIIMLTTPVFVFIINTLNQHKKWSWQSILGLLLSLSSALYLVGMKKFSVNQDHTIGNLLILLNALSYGFYLFYVKRLTKKYPSQSIIKWLFLSGLIFVFPIGFSQLTQIELATWSTGVYAIVIFVVLGTTFLTYLLNFSVIKHGGSVLAGSYIYLQPVLASIIAVCLGADVLSIKKIICTFVLIFGLYLINIKSNG